MHKYINLTKRNCLVFLRDHATVFFALLSMMIVLMLQGVFLGEMNVESVTNLLLQYGGIRDIVVDKENAVHLIQYWTLAGILMVNAVTVTLTVIGTMVRDGEENRLESLYSAPVSKNIIALAYVSAAVIVGIVFCTITLTAAIIYIKMTGGRLLGMDAIVQIMGYVALNVFIFAIIMYLAALFVRSSGAWSGIATIVGTLVGFVGAIYLPMGELPETVAKVLKGLPILHGASLMRKICCEQALLDTFKGMPAEVIEEYKNHMGITVTIQDTVVGNVSQIAFLVFCGIAALLVIGVVAGKRNISDR